MRKNFGPLVLTIAFLATGGAFHLVAGGTTARVLWLAGVVVMGTPLVWRTLRGAVHGRFASDVVASLSVIGAVVLGEPLVALVIVLMQTGGEALERHAEGRASVAVRALEAAAPRVAHLIRDEEVSDLPVTSIAVGDLLLIRPGEMIPCDGSVVDGESELDTSSLTGEAAPMRATVGVAVMSGMLNALGSFRMRVTAPAEQSQYARIVELVRTAQASKAPLQRLADRYAVWFTPLTVAVCIVAVAVTHDWMRALAILVVATPCPLILATPVAIIGGINRAAKQFIIVRHGGALERLSEVNAVVFDKTGTITVGKPRIHDVRVAPGFTRETVLRYAAAVEEHSSHLLARVLVDFAKHEDVRPPASSDQVESPGMGVDGVVETHRVRVGARAFVLQVCVDGATLAASLEQSESTLRAYVAIDGRLAGVLEYADEIRPELAAVFDRLTAQGVRRLVLLSGDHQPIVRSLATRVGVREAHGDLLPGDKSRFIERMQAEGDVVMMVGDGINDAPALSAADVGIALAAHGGGITAEAADVILLVDSLTRVADAKDVGHRTLRIARQSIWAGLGLSAVAMVAAAFGALPPLAGAMLQEAIDVGVILNALRTSMAPRPSSPLAGGAGAGVTPVYSSADALRRRNAMMSNVESKNIKALHTR